VGRASLRQRRAARAHQVPVAAGASDRLCEPRGLVGDPHGRAGTARRACCPRQAPSLRARSDHGAGLHWTHTGSRSSRGSPSTRACSLGPLAWTYWTVTASRRRSSTRAMQPRVARAWCAAQLKSGELRTGGRVLRSQTTSVLIVGARQDVGGSRPIVSHGRCAPRVCPR
jgi:hypothetical protein